MRFYDLGATDGPALFAILSLARDVFTPQAGADGVVRWQPADGWPELPVPRAAQSPKVFLLPPAETVWGDAPTESVGRRVALVGVPVCDLAAVAHLDRVFVADASWQRRRQNLILVGAPCVPDAACFCPSPAGLPPCDLFIDAQRLWLCSSRAEILFARSGRPLSDAGDFPELPAGRGGEKLLGGPLPSAETLEPIAGRCLGCGACSSVCPTCHCFDIREEITDAGTVQRRRVWDSCQFVEHGRVAGGHNFRALPVERQQFRLEHKLLGFGSGRGTGLCVGCGRCSRACPSGLGLRDLLSISAGKGGAE